MTLECPVCLNSLLEPVPADVPCPIAGCSPNEPCEGCGGGGTQPENNGGRKRRRANARLHSATSVTPCGHIFHTRCLTGWVQEAIGRPTCPTCRNPFTKNRVIPVYLNSSDGANSDEADIPPQPYNNANPQEVVNAEDVIVEPYDGSDMADLRMRHNTLISDFNELKAKFWELKDEDDFRIAQIMSLEQENQNLLQKLRDTEAEAEPSGASPMATTSGRVPSSRKRGAVGTRSSPRAPKRGRPVV